MTATVLIVEDNPTTRELLTPFILEAGYELREAGTLSEGNEFIDRGEADIVVLDVELPDGYGLDLLERVVRDQLPIQVVVVTGYGDIDMAVEAMKLGACDFIPKPLDMARLMPAIARAADLVRLRRELARHRNAHSVLSKYIIGQTPYMRQLEVDLSRVAQSDASVLITGDSGTGKEGLAQALHDASRRAGKAFFPVNCADFPEHLVESELFGHEPNAFSGAGARRKDGVFHAADGGTLFLDELANLRRDLQAHLLRVLENRTIRRVGSNTFTKVDVRIIAATNRDLKEMVARGEFREDLYHRLRVLELRLPPLRERIADIPDLVGYYVQFFNREQGRNVVQVNPTAMRALKAHDWPGNIRELRNALQRAFIYADGDTLELRHFPAEITEALNRIRQPITPPLRPNALGEAAAPLV